MSPVGDCTLFSHSTFLYIPVCDGKIRITLFIIYLNILLYLLLQLYRLEKMSATLVLFSLDLPSQVAVSIICLSLLLSSLSRPKGNIKGKAVAVELIVEHLDLRIVPFAYALPILSNLLKLFLF